MHLRFKTIRFLTFLSCCSLLLASCQKEVHISLASSPAQIVVQGAIETNMPPYVLLTSTISFFSKVDLNTLQNSFIHGANVQITCGAKTVTLKEYSLDTAGGNHFYVYSLDTGSINNIMIGQVDSTYKLSITYNGVTYTSVTKIPNPKGLDSMWFAPPLFKNRKTPDNALELFCNYTDPDTPGNYVRYFSRRNNEPFYPSQLFSDEVVNGKPITDLALPAGYDHVTDANQDSLLYFYPGDTVYIKWCEIDKGVYDFWNTYNFANNAIGNPFATPINVKSNISNGALGVWAGYGSAPAPYLVVPH